MKTKIHSALCIPSFLLSALCLRAWGQYSIDWSTIDGGGTIGQPDAGRPMTGGNFSVAGGFWSLYSVQTPGAPSLRIFLTSSNTGAVAWPSPSTGWLPQQNTKGVSSVNWSNVTDTIQDNGAIKYIIVTPPTGTRFYRLSKP